MSGESKWRRDRRWRERRRVEGEMRCPMAHPIFVSFSRAVATQRNTEGGGGRW